MNRVSARPGVPDKRIQRVIRYYYAWQMPVVSSTLAAEPTLGVSDAEKRYVVPVGATGVDWVGMDGSVAEWTGFKWVFIAPTEGMAVYDITNNHFIYYDGAVWNPISGALAGVLLQDGSRPLTNAWDVNGFEITGLPAPTVGDSAANKDYIDGLVQGLDWQESVKDFIDFTTSEPGAPTVGDRYINTTTGVMSGTAQACVANHIYQWNSVDWTDINPDEGTAVWVEDEDINYVWNGASWIKFAATITHNNLSTIQGGNVTERYHLTATQHGLIGATNIPVASLAPGVGGQYLQTVAGVPLWVTPPPVPAHTLDPSGGFHTGYLSEMNLDCESTMVLWVDGSRTDVYTADGTRTRPYKTIAAALAVATNMMTVLVQPKSGGYTETNAPGVITIPSGVSLVGIGMVEVTGSVVANPLFRGSFNSRVANFRISNMQNTSLGGFALTTGQWLIVENIILNNFRIGIGAGGPGRVDIRGVYGIGDPTNTNNQLIALSNCISDVSAVYGYHCSVVVGAAGALYEQCIRDILLEDDGTHILAGLVFAAPVGALTATVNDTAVLGFSKGLEVGTSGGTAVVRLHDVRLSSGTWDINTTPFTTGVQILGQSCELDHNKIFNAGGVNIFTLDFYCTADSAFEIYPAETKAIIVGATDVQNLTAESNPQALFKPFITKTIGPVRECPYDAARDPMEGYAFLPEDYEQNTIAVKILWTTDVVAAGNVYWRVSVWRYRNGDYPTPNALFPNIYGVQDTCPATAGHIKESTLAMVSGMNDYQPGEPLAVMIERVWTSGLDTFDHPAYWAVVKVEYQTRRE